MNPGVVAGIAIAVFFLGALLVGVTIFCIFLLRAMRELTDALNKAVADDRLNKMQQMLWVIGTRMPEVAKSLSATAQAFEAISKAMFDAERITEQPRKEPSPFGADIPSGVTASDASSSFSVPRDDMELNVELVQQALRERGIETSEEFAFQPSPEQGISAEA